MQITKCNVVEAILSENLLNGSWVFFKGRDQSSVEESIEAGCQVCAVGAVLRQNINQKRSLQELHTACVLNVRRSTPLSALSGMYENTADIYGHNSVNTRYLVAQWIIDNFPETLELDVES